MHNFSIKHFFELRSEWDIFLHHTMALTNRPTILLPTPNLKDNKLLQNKNISEILIVHFYL